MRLTCRSETLTALGLWPALVRILHLVELACLMPLTVLSSSFLVCMESFSTRRPIHILPHSPSRSSVVYPPILRCLLSARYAPDHYSSRPHQLTTRALFPAPPHALRFVLRPARRDCGQPAVPAPSMYLWTTGAMRAKCTMFLPFLRSSRRS